MVNIIRRFDKVYETVVSRLPGRVAAGVDWYRSTLRNALPGSHGSMHGGFAGPFNGQARRNEIISAMLDRVAFNAFVETGTHRGVTADYVAKKGVPVYTVELAERYYWFAKRRFSHLPTVQITLGDSREFLRDLAKSRRLSEPVFFYLDAHWYGDLPLREELELIPAHWKDWLVLIDDFRVDDDPGYRFDDYGPGKTVSVDILPESILQKADVFWPVAPSSTETGYRRGCAFIASHGRVADAAGSLSLLRPAAVRRVDAARP
jgi:hypothetical protein